MENTNLAQTRITVHPFADRFRLLTGAELDALANDIHKNGLANRLKARRLDTKTAELLDGRNRLAAMRSRGIADAAILAAHVDFVDIPDEQVPAFVLSQNLHRRHLTQSEQRAVVEAHVLGTPELSNRQIAEKAGVSAPTIAAVRAGLVATGQVSPVTRTIGKDGKTRPAARPKSSRDISTGPQRVAPALKPAPTTPEAMRAALAPSAKERLDAAIRTHKARLDSEYDQRVYQTAQETARQILKNHFDSLDKRLTQIEQRQDKLPLSMAEWNKFVLVSHPDRSASKELCEEVTRLLVERKAILCPDKATELAIKAKEARTKAFNELSRKQFAARAAREAAKAAAKATARKAHKSGIESK